MNKNKRVFLPYKQIMSTLWGSVLSEWPLASFIRLCMFSLLIFSIPNSMLAEIRPGQTNRNSGIVQPEENAISRLQSCYDLAAGFQERGNYYRADSLIESVLTKVIFKDDSALYIRFLILDAENKKVMDRFEESLERLISVLHYRERKNDQKGILESYLLFAEYYRAADNYGLALSYLYKANEQGNAISGGFPVQLKSRMMNRKAAIFLEQGVYLDSVEYLSKEVIHMARQTGDQNQVAISSNELGFLYLNTGRPEAEFYFLQAISIWDKLGYGIYENNARLNLARYFIQSNQAVKAVALADASLKIVGDLGWDWEKGYWFEILAKGYKMKGENESAYTYMVKAKDQLLINARNQYQERLAYYSSKLELKEREEEINLKNVEMGIANKEISLKSRENKILFSFLLLVFILLFGAMVGIIIIYRQKKLVATQKAKIDQINLTLENLVAQKEILLKEVNHRVKNNLSLLSGMIYLKEKELKNEEAIMAIQDMQVRINTISQIHEMLYKSDDFEFVDFNEFLITLTKQAILIYPGANEVHFKIRCQGFNPELSVAVPLAMMVNELLTNSMKHAFKTKRHPLIQIEYNPEQSQLVYWDNGIGYDPNTVSSSLGTTLLNIFARQIHAELIFEKEVIRMIVRIRLPKPNLT